MAQVRLPVQLFGPNMNDRIEDEILIELHTKIRFHQAYIIVWNKQDICQGVTEKIFPRREDMVGVKQHNMIVLVIKILLSLMFKYDMRLHYTKIHAFAQKSTRCQSEK